MSSDETLVPRILSEPVQLEQCLDEGAGLIAEVHVATLPPDFYASNKGTDWTAALRAAAQEPPPSVEQRLAALEERLAALEAERK